MEKNKLVEQLKVNISKINYPDKLEKQLKTVCEYLIKRSGKNLDYNITFGFNTKPLSTMIMKIEYRAKMELCNDEDE